MWTRDEKVIWLAEKNSHKDKFLGRVKMPSQQKTERAFQSMQAYISNCPLGSKKQSNNFQFKNSLASKLIFPENQNLLITPLAVCALLLKERQPKGPDEEWNNQWWENGYHQ